MVEGSSQPVTVDASHLTLQALAERITTERAIREQAQKYVADEYRANNAEIQRRLGELNHAHQQAIDAQARTVPRELFDQFVKENDSRREQAFSSLGSRLETAIENAQTSFATSHDSLGKEIEIERNARIRAEGSVAVWRFIAVFLGFPGVIALILAAIALFGPNP